MIRTLLIYVFLIIIMRLMGKRQIGELEVTDLVTTFLLSEIASLPLTDTNIPVLHAVVPIVTLLALEVFSSYLLLRLPRLKNWLSARPTILIDNGVLDARALLEARISPDELMGEIRRTGLSSPEQVECAILEKNGKLTILPKSDFSPVTAGQMKLPALPGTGLMHIVYNCGVVSDAGLSLIGRDRAWLKNQFNARRLTPEKVFFAVANREGDFCWYAHGERKKS